MSGAIASRLSAVSTSVSPLTRLDVCAAMFSVSALSRFSAISKEVLVRVLASKKRFTTVFPRSAGTFLIGRSPISRIASAVSRISRISSGVRSEMPSRSLCRSFEIVATCCVVMGIILVARPPPGRALRRVRRSLGEGGADGHFVDAVCFRETHGDRFFQRRRYVLADIVRFDRELAMAPIDEHNQ